MKFTLFTIILPFLFSTASSLKLPNFAASKSYDGKFYDSTQKLDFSDFTESEINNYYGDIENKKGDDLLNYLYTKISCKTEELEKYYLTYGSGIQGVSKWYQITDRNWSISEEINPDTFKFITNASDSRVENTYFYNMYISDAANNDVTKAYSTLTNGYKVDDSLTKIDYQNQKKPKSLIRIDKEHVWAKSHGFEVTNNEFTIGAQTDLHHLVAADGNTNSSGHNNYSYGEVDHSTSKVIYNYLADGSSEISGWLDTKTNTFEPTDEWKGDIARCLFYMATRYSNKKETNTKEEPYLVITDDTSIKNDNSKCYGVQYNLSTLITWNDLDPVSNYEIHRNNLIYHNVQNNRNPYIDHPEWVKRVFNPESISPFSNLKSSYNLHIGSPLDLKLESTKDITYTIDDESIISYKDSIITPLKEGVAKLTLKDAENNEITIEINVKKEVIKSLDLESTNLILDNNSTFDLGSKIHLENTFNTDSILYEIENSSSISISDKGVITTGLFKGKANIKVYLVSQTEKQLLYEFSVETKYSKTTIIIFIVAIAALILLIIILFIINSKMKKSKKKKIAKKVKKQFVPYKNSSNKKKK